MLLVEVRVDVGVGEVVAAAAACGGQRCEREGERGVVGLEAGAGLGDGARPVAVAFGKGLVDVEEEEVVVMVVVVAAAAEPSNSGLAAVGRAGMPEGLDGPADVEVAKSGLLPGSGVTTRLPRAM